MDEVCGYLDKFVFEPGSPENMLKATFTDMQWLYSLSKNIRNTMTPEMEQLWEVYQFMIYEDPARHLPVPVYSFIKPTINTRFILHLLLSMGHFETEYDMILHPTLRESFRYAKLIGAEDDEESLKKYCNELVVKYIKGQLVHYPNGYKLTGSWIIVAKQLLESVIIHNEIQITDMPPVLQSDLDNYKN